jgi:hypothetical protein
MGAPRPTTPSFACYLRAIEALLFFPVASIERQRAAGVNHAAVLASLIDANVGAMIFRFGSLEIRSLLVLCGGMWKRWRSEK